MSSHSLQRWQSVRTAEMDELENAHRSVGGLGRGRRYATRQINHAYAVLISSHFQGFCRDLHTESSRIIVAAIRPLNLQPLAEQEYLRNRRLDRGNPSPGNIGADFSRLGVTLWPELYGLNLRHQQRRLALEELNEWRNAIAH